jgi:(5-formylfuran-3-yl)methyl phosphate synthase
MLLLVSVRSAAEVGAALSGGADIVDAKDPSRGPLGAVQPWVMREIVARVPDHTTVSVALGDLTTPAEIASSLALLQLPERAGPVYLKLGCAGVSSIRLLERLVMAAVAAARRECPSTRIVAVAYADANRTGSASPDVVCQIGAHAGASGVLLDTGIKDGRNLFCWIDPSGLGDWIGRAREAGLVAAVAGGLGLGDMPLVTRAQPDVVGVRSAACEGGRLGVVSEGRVRALRQWLDSSSGSLQGAEGPSAGFGRETRDPGANSLFQSRLSS